MFLLSVGLTDLTLSFIAGALVAGCWAAMMKLGEEGYLEATRTIVEKAKKIANGCVFLHFLFEVISHPFQ
jgi:glutamate/tyrosine decarboxylase-like PLP-dependent enzyme